MIALHPTKNEQMKGRRLGVADEKKYPPLVDNGHTEARPCWSGNVRKRRTFEPRSSIQG